MQRREDHGTARYDTLSTLSSSTSLESQQRTDNARELQLLLLSAPLDQRSFLSTIYTKNHTIFFTPSLRSTTYLPPFISCDDPAFECQ